MRLREVSRPRPLLRAGLRDESGATLVEFAIVLSIFLLILFGLIDFGRLGYTWVMADKAMQRAARIAAVSRPLCTLPNGDPLPDFNERSDATGQEFGNSCNISGICTDPGTASCTRGDATATELAIWDDEIWPSIAGLMPSGASADNVQFTYTFDQRLGFLGGPYTPRVTAELKDATFKFVSPLGGLARLAGALGAADIGTPCDGMFCISIPAMSVSLPGEDLAQGSSG